MSLTAAVPTSLVLYYNFDQGTSNGANTGLTTVYDLKNATAGTLTNVALASGNTVSKGVGLPGNTAGLVAYYRLNEGSGLTVADATGGDGR